MAGCSQTGSAEPAKISKAKLTKARGFRDFEIPWLGDSFEGLPLNEIDLPNRRNGETASVFYSDCPATYEAEPDCQYVSLTVDAVQEAAPPRDARRFNGLPAMTGTDEFERATVHVFGKGIDIVLLSGGTDKDLALRAAGSLRPLNRASRGAPTLR